MKKKKELTEAELNQLAEQYSDAMRKEIGRMSPEDIKRAFDKARQIAVDTFPPITTSEWTGTHPTGIVCGSDKFYAGLATEIAKSFFELIPDGTLPEGLYRVIGMASAAYLEDLKSDTNVWNSIRNLYRNRYGAQVPFFETDDEYYEDDINIEDLKVIIWQAFNRCGGYEERTFSPHSEAVEKMADIVFDILVDKFDAAPPATRVRDLLRKTFRSGEYIQVRTLAHWLSTQHPLTSSPFAKEHIDAEIEEAEVEYASMGKLDSEQVAYIVNERYSWLDYIGLTGDPSNVLLGELARQCGFETVADKLLTVKEEPAGVYTVSRQDSRFLYITDDFGNEFKVIKQSFVSGIDFEFIKSGIFKIVRFGDIYYQSGLCSLSEDLPKKTSEIESMKMPPELLENVNKAVELHDGRRVFYLKKMKDIGKLLGSKFVPYPHGEPEFQPKNILLMLSGTDGPIIRTDCCDIFDDKENSFRKKRETPELGENAWAFIVNSDLPDDVIEYIVSHKLLPSAFMHTSQGQEFGKKVVQENMDFLFRFYRVESYPPPGFYEDEDDDDDDEDDDYEDYGDDDNLGTTMINPQA